MVDKSSLFLSLLSQFRCRFSQMLKPIFEQTADILKEEYPVRLVIEFCRHDFCRFCFFFLFSVGYSTPDIPQISACKLS